MSLTIIKCDINHRIEEVPYDGPPIPGVLNVLRGVVVMEITLTTGAPLPCSSWIGSSFEDWFANQIAPSLPAETVRRLITSLTARLLNAS